MINRRDFLIRGALAGAGSFLAGRTAQAQTLYTIGASDRVRIGMIGLNAGARRNISAFAALGNVEIAAICDPDPKRLREALSLYSKDTSRRPLTTDDPRRLFDLTDLDAVCISSPQSTRSETVKEALRSGKNVFADGPVSRSITEAKSLIDISVKQNCIIGQNERVNFHVPRNFAVANRILAEDFTRAVGRANLGALRSSTLSSRQKSGRRTSSVEHLPDTAYDFLDMGRHMLNAGMPSRVSTIDSGLGRKAVEVEFANEKGLKKHLTFELVSSGDARERTSHPGVMSFFSSAGSFEINANGSSNGRQDGSCFENFLSCVRRGTADDLQNPLVEARRSIAILQLAELSFDFGRTINFDPVSETVTDDTEVARCL